jgi:protein involved in polysaccharide export with SLBB domain
MIAPAPGTRLSAMILIASLLADCSVWPPPTVPPAATGAPGPVITASTGRSETGVAGYRLGPGDQIRLTVVRHGDLSGRFEIDGEGFLPMPLVGEVQSAGLTARELEKAIEDQLRSGGYLVNPQVSIEVLNYRPFYIIGEINNPGSYQYVNGMTVTSAVALAGGFTDRADQGDITITRGGSSGPHLEATPSTEVLPGDIIEVAERSFQEPVSLDERPRTDH